LYDWGKWDKALPQLPRRRRRPMMIVIYPTANGSCWMPISAWERSVLELIEQPSTLDRVIQALLNGSEHNDSASRNTESRVRKAVQAAYAASFVVTDPFALEN
jgi:DNA-binding NtrC family response regulator